MARSIRGRLQRGVRRFLLGSGPLKRTSDRVQVAGRVLVVLAILAAVPVALVAAGMARSRLEAVAAAQATERHVVGATVIEDTVSTVTGADAGASTVSIVQARVRWHAPDSTTRYTYLVVPAGTRAGTRVPVWVDRAGNLTTAPMDPVSIGDSALVVAIAVTVGLPLTVVALHYGLCFGLDVHRRRRWGQDWARVEREWRARL
jgi:hypothetical protein